MSCSCFCVVSSSLWDSSPDISLEEGNPSATGANLKYSKKNYYGVCVLLNKLISTACMCSVHWKSLLTKEIYK
jgi:hypothetical protein